MKNLLNYITAALFMSLLVFASCGEDDPDPQVPDEDLEEIADKLTGSTTVNNVDKPDDATDLDWSALTVTLTGDENGGTYTTTGSADPTVWPASGSWVFQGTVGDKILRDNDVVVDIAFSPAEGTPTSVVMTFDIEQPAATKSVGGVIEGTWVFTLDY